MNIVEKVDFLSKLSLIDIGKVGSVNLQRINASVNTFDPPASEKLKALTDESTAVVNALNKNNVITIKTFISNLPDYLQRGLALYQDDFSYDSNSRHKIVSAIVSSSKVVSRLKPKKEYLLFFTDALAIDDPTLVRTMLVLIERGIIRLANDNSPELNGAILAVLDPLGDSFEVTTCIRADHQVRDKYTALLTTLCRHYARRQNTTDSKLRALAMPKPLLGKTYHVFRTMKRATNRGNLDEKYRLSYGLQACRRIESDQSSAQRRRRRIWDLVSVVSGSGGFIEEDSSRTTFQVAPEKLAEAFHIKSRLVYQD